jgi:hypothetical protein
MIMSPAGLRTKNNCAGEDHRHFTRHRHNIVRRMSAALLSQTAYIVRPLFSTKLDIAMLTQAYVPLSSIAMLAFATTNTANVRNDRISCVVGNIQIQIQASFLTNIISSFLWAYLKYHQQNIIWI